MKKMISYIIGQILAQQKPSYLPHTDITRHSTKPLPQLWVVYGSMVWTGGVTWIHYGTASDILHDTRHNF